MARVSRWAWKQRQSLLDLCAYCHPSLSLGQIVNQYLGPGPLGQDPLDFSPTQRSDLEAHLRRTMHTIHLQKHQQQMRELDAKNPTCLEDEALNWLR